MGENIVIYTAQVGYVDRVKLYEPKPFTVDWLGFKRTGRKYSRQVARRIKMLGHQYVPEEYDIYIWVDSKERVVSDIRPYVEKYLSDTDWCCMTEYRQYGTDLYDAAWSDVANNRNSEEFVKKQLGSYKREGLPRDVPIYKTPCVMRRRTPEVIKQSDEWYREWVKWQDPEYGFGDQVALAYVAWKMKIKISRMPIREMHRLIDRTPWTDDPAEFMTNEGAL